MALSNKQRVERELAKATEMAERMGQRLQTAKVAVSNAKTLQQQAQARYDEAVKVADYLSQHPLLQGQQELPFKE